MHEEDTVRDMADRHPLDFADRFDDGFGVRVVPRADRQITHLEITFDAHDVDRAGITLLVRDGREDFGEHPECVVDAQPHGETVANARCCLHLWQFLLDCDRCYSCYCCYRSTAPIIVL